MPDKRKTIELPDAVMKKAETIARNNHKTVEAVIAEAIDLAFDVDSGKAKVTRPEFIPKKESPGGHGIQVSVQRKEGR